MKTAENLFQKELNDDEIDRFKRHLTLNEIGYKGQEKLKNSSVIFVGAGGLGSSAILYTAASGIGKIGIIDNDVIEKSNLQRQVIHNSDHIGKSKTESAKSKIKQLNPNCEVLTFSERIIKKNILEIINTFDIVCDCSDNFGTRFLINDACIILNKPLIFGSVQGFEGQISVFNFKKNSPNLRDLISRPPKKDLIPNCNEYGVIGVSTGLIGVLQANEIIKIIVGTGEILDGKLLVFNLLNLNMKKLNLKIYSKNKKIRNLTEFEDDYEDQNCLINNQKIKKISNREFQKIHRNQKNEIIIIDVREKHEFMKFSLKGSISIPLSLLEKSYPFNKIKNTYSEKTIYIICQKGLRSEKALRILNKENIEAISVEGGLENMHSIDS